MQVKSDKCVTIFSRKEALMNEIYDLMLPLDISSLWTFPLKLLLETCFNS